MYDAYDGKVESGLFFTGSNGYRLNEIITVKELMDKLEFTFVLTRAARSAGGDRYETVLPGKTKAWALYILPI